MIHNKFWQGFFALTPILSFALFFIGYFGFVFFMITNAESFEQHSEPPMELFGGLAVFMITILLVVLISLGSLVFYIVHAAQNPNLKQNNMLLVWVLLFLFASGIGQLIYWLVEIKGKQQ